LSYKILHTSFGLLLGNCLRKDRISSVMPWMGLALSWSLVVSLVNLKTSSHRVYCYMLKRFSSIFLKLYKSFLYLLKYIKSLYLFLEWKWRGECVRRREKI
jgi:hypothetical protein